MKRIAIALLFATPMLAQTVTGRFAPGEQYVEPERNAPPSTSRMFVRAADSQGVDLPVTGQGGMIVVVGERTSSSAPLFQRFAVDADGHEVLHIDKPAAGRYHVNVHAGTLVIAAEPDSTLTMTTTVGPLSRTPGDALTLHATLRDGDDAIAGAQVIAHLTSPDGKESDSIALTAKGNGDYEATIDDVPSHVNGFWTVRYDATGVNDRGIEFARTGSNQFMNERPTARLGMIHSQKTGDTLHVNVNARVLESGRYRLDVIVASKDRRGIAWGESEMVLDPGAKQLSIDIPGVQENDLFLDVRLLDLDSMGVAGRVTSESVARRTP